MRLLLGGSLLIVLFLAAALWQRNWTSAARAERSAERGEASAVSSEGPSAVRSGWSRVVIGRPSGAEPYRSPGPSAPRTEAAIEAAARIAPQSSPTESSAQVSSSQVVVQSGQSLSSICREHYGTARIELVEAVSRHNHLASPDRLREGQKLELPALDQLLEKH